MRLLIVQLLIMLIPSVAVAKMETIYASFKYTLSDNDSRNDARRFAFIEAKKLALEKAVSFIESEQLVKDYSITKYDIKTYTWTIIDVQIDREEFVTSSGSQVLNMTVKAPIDLIPVITTLDIIRVDKDLQEKVIKNQMRLNELESKLNKIQKSIYSESKSEKAIYLRKNRADILMNMSDTLSKTESEVLPEIAKLQKSIDMTSAKVINNVRNGMTANEVKEILGKPRRGNAYFDKSNKKSIYCENYGKYWIIIDIDSVIGYVPYDKYNGCTANTVHQLTAFDNLIK